MPLRHVAACFCAVTLLAGGALLLRAQPSQASRENAPGIGRDKLRAQVIKLRTEVEALRLDYQIARDGLLEDIKLQKQLKLSGELMGGFLSLGFGAPAEKSGRFNPQQKTEEDRKKEAEAAKQTEEAKKYAVQEAAAIAERENDLSRRFGLLAAKQMDLEDAERSYREQSR
jgi:hypothetical protein